jgi:hypothetical protein
MCVAGETRRLPVVQRDRFTLVLNDQSCVTSSDFTQLRLNRIVFGY